MKFAVRFVLALAFAAALASAQTPSYSEMLNAGAIDELAEAAREATRADEGDGEAWFWLGRAQLERGKHRSAQEALERAADLGFRPAAARFHAAEAAGHRDRTADALRLLDDAVKGGFARPDALASSAFDDFRTAREFLAVAEEMERRAKPCMYDERYRQFDFWVGSWEVRSTDGTPQGENVIRRVENGCALIESWTSASGGSGTSLNWFDPLEEKWRQDWVDGRGGNIRLTGALTGGSMTLQGKHVKPDGTMELIRGRWTPMADGRVRQYFEQSKDAGQTWYVWFEGFYSRKEP